jgi:pyruvate kinase
MDTLSGYMDFLGGIDMQVHDYKKRWESLYDELYVLRQDVLKEGNALFEIWKPHIERKAFHYSAWNLAFYLALRCHDLRGLQKKLLPLGLSSLGRSEARAIDNLDAVMASLGRICHKPEREVIDYPSRKTFFYGDELLTYNTSRIFGSGKAMKHTHVMVTLPSEAATNPDLLCNLVKSGMDCARINCAHDSRDKWAQMLEYIHKAEKKTGRRCRIYMDLSGPKVRISAVLIRGAESKVAAGDTLFLVSGDINKYPADYKGNVVLACSIPEIFQHLKTGQPVLIDDGKIKAEVTALVPEGAYICVNYAKPQGTRIKNQKSLNFPKTEICISPLTPKDLKDLDFIAAHADAVGYSFVKTAQDIQLLQNELIKRNGKQARKIAIVAKIETKAGVDHLPEIIVQAASKQPLAIMIARGDLAVEVGYRRLAELQEEILWICEAAHVPVIWATQVLENMVKTGIPSRAEITDAAMSERAECVMLNKGPYVVEAVTSLGNILERMEQHQHKKASQLRALNIAKCAMHRIKK